MRNKRVSWLLVICSIIIQHYIMVSSRVFNINLPFATALMTPETPDENSIIIMLSFIPIPFIIILFAGRLEELTRGYGKLLIIRHYSRVRLIITELAKVFMEVLIIVSFMISLSFIFPLDGWHKVKIWQVLAIICTYSLVIMCTLLMEYLIELMFFISQGILLTNLLFSGGMIISNIVTAGGNKLYLNYILFPNLAFARKNGILEQEDGSLIITILVEFIIILVLGTVNLIKYKGKDII